MKCRREKTEDVWQEFEQVQGEIELLLNDEENEEATAYRVDFEETYFKAVSMCEDLMYERRNEQTKKNGEVDVMINNEVSNMVVPVPQVTTNSGSGSCCNNSNAPIQLAAIGIPTFSGRHSEWPTYYDIFGAMVHTNDRISDIQRFFHLRASLSGEAA